MTRARSTALLTASTVRAVVILGTHERGRGRPASSLVILLRIRTGSCLLPCDGRQASSAGLVPSELLTFVVVVIVVLSFVVVVSVTELVLIDSNASVAGAADTGTHGRRVAAGADHLDGRHLADEDSIALGVGRHRMRAQRLRDLLDQEVRVGVDDAEHGRLLIRRRAGRARYGAIPAGPDIVALIALVEPDLIGAGDVNDGGLLLGLGIDHQRRRVARAVLRGAAQQQIVVRSDRGAVWVAGVEQDHPGVGGRIEGPLDRGWRGRIGHKQTAVAGDRSGQLPVIATRRVVG